MAAFAIKERGDVACTAITASEAIGAGRNERSTGSPTRLDTFNDDEGAAQ